MEVQKSGLENELTRREYLEKTRNVLVDIGNQSHTVLLQEIV